MESYQSGSLNRSSNEKSCRPNQRLSGSECRKLRLEKLKRSRLIQSPQRYMWCQHDRASVTNHISHSQHVNFQLDFTGAVHFNESLAAGLQPTAWVQEHRCRRKPKLSWNTTTRSPWQLQARLVNPMSCSIQHVLFNVPPVPSIGSPGSDFETSTISPPSWYTSAMTEINYRLTLEWIESKQFIGSTKMLDLCTNKAYGCTFKLIISFHDLFESRYVRPFF